MLDENLLYDTEISSLLAINQSLSEWSTNGCEQVYDDSTKDKEIIIAQKEADCISFALNHSIYDKMYGSTTFEKDVVVKAEIKWNSSSDFAIKTSGSVIFEDSGKIISEKDGNIIIKAGIDRNCSDTQCSSIIFKGDSAQLVFSDQSLKGIAKLYYNPEKGNESHKFRNPSDYSRFVIPNNKLESYMLVNNVYDLQMINLFLSANYALSYDIDASMTKNWDKGKGFLPLGKETRSFSGNFDGNEYSVSNLFIYRAEEENVGLFGFSSGSVFHPNIIKDVKINNFNVTGNTSVNPLVGMSVLTAFKKIYADGKLLVSDNC